MLPALRLLFVLLILSTGACSLLPGRDPLLIDVAGMDPLPGQGLEMRMAVKLRVQNPNDNAVDYRGVALRLEVNGRLLATGVSDQGGRIEGFSERVVSVPVSISAFSALRQALGLASGQPLTSLPYTLYGKLANGPFATWRFSESGTLRLPDNGQWPR